MFAPASEWKGDVERITYYAHSDVKQYAAQLVCDFSNKPALTKSKQPWSQHRMFLTCYKKECNFFMRVDQLISHGIKELLSYSPQPRVTRFHPYGEIKEMFENIVKRLNRKTMCYVRRITSTQERTGISPKITECWRFCLKFSKREKRRPGMRLLLAG